MANTSALKDRVKTFFQVQGSQEGPAAFSDEDETPEFARSIQNEFSAFDPNDQDRQADLLIKTMNAFTSADDTDDGVVAAMDILESAARSGDLQMAQNVLGIFAVHASKIRGETTSLPIPPSVFEVPEEEGPTPFDDEDEDDEGGVTAAPTGEDLLHWFREDIHLNEHHRHWHMVYTTTGIPSGTPDAPTFPVRMKSRQGEVFIYMHRQMLARYETERVTAGLEPTVAFDDFEQSLGDGYEPDVREPSGLGYAARPANVTLDRTQQLDLENRREAYRVFLQTGKVAGQDVPINPSTVGAALESNSAMLSTSFNSNEEWRQARVLVSSLQLHNFGHGAIARAGDPGAGVMTNPHTSLQDPAFWRWHKMIDDLAEDFYSTLPPYDFSSSQLQAKSNPDDSSQLVLFADTDVSGLNLDNVDTEALTAIVADATRDAIAANQTGAAELRTGFREEKFKYSGAFHGPAVPDRTFKRDSLFCERFAVGLRVVSPEDIEATARLLICADTFLDLDLTTRPDGRRSFIRANEHRFWIELDRKPYTLTTGENFLTFVADRSSVVRKLRGRAIWPTSAITEADFDELHSDARGDRDDYCDCGWPLNLLLPRGTETGMDFKMMAMISEGSPSVALGECGSRSFCGSDFDGYPELDEINMGFPFDRPAQNGTLMMIQSSPNMAMRSFKIRHVPDLWDGLNPSA